MNVELATDRRFLDSIRRHFVGLAGTFVREREPSAGVEQAFCYSGFVIEICGQWCLVTAGHILNDLDSVLRSEGVRLLKCVLADYFSREAKCKEPTPFVYEDVHRIPVDKAGMDIGLIPLRDYYRQHLAANGVLPLRVAEWKGYSPPVFEQYAVLGLPDENKQPRERMGDRGAQIGYLTTLNLIGVQALPRPPADRIVSGIPRFAGALLDGGKLNSVEGMSGGPILGIRKTSAGLEYAGVAVQGSWDRRRRMIYGTPLGIVVEQVTKLLMQEKK